MATAARAVPSAAAGSTDHDDAGAPQSEHPRLLRNMLPQPGQCIGM